MQRVSRMALWNFDCFDIFCPPYCFKCILLVNWIMIYVLSWRSKKNKLILCSLVYFIITLVWHSRLLVCVSLAPRRCSLLGKALRLTVSVCLTPTNVFRCKAQATWDRRHLYREAPARLHSEFHLSYFRLVMCGCTAPTLTLTVEERSKWGEKLATRQLVVIGGGWVM